MSDTCNNTNIFYPSSALGKAFGKSIISGEHSVVYGQPAIVLGIDKSIVVQIDFFPRSHVFKDNLYSLDEIFWDCIFIDNTQNNSNINNNDLEQDVTEDNNLTCNNLGELFKKCETWQARFLEFKAALDKNLDTTALLKKIFDTPEEFIFNAIGYLLKDAIYLKYLAKTNLNNLDDDAISDHNSDSNSESLVGDFSKDIESILNNNYAQIEKMLVCHLSK